MWCGKSVAIVTNETSGERIRKQFEQARERVLIVAPFIKTGALRSLLSAIDDDIAVRCVTRWLPREIAAGVSDLDVFELLERRQGSELVLVDRLHAKLYVADDRCLVGSANVTFAGLGESQEANLEVLVESDVADPGVRTVLEEVEVGGRPATRLTVDATQRLVESLPEMPATDELDAWFPISRRPEMAYQFYEDPRTGERTTGVQLLVKDVAMANLPAGLPHETFRREIRNRLSAIPIAASILATTEDVLLTRSDAQPYLSTKKSDAVSSEDMWVAFVKWMAHFHSDSVMEQEITEVALRRAQVLNP